MKPTKCPLLEKPRRPIIYDTFSFGGDDLLGYVEQMVNHNHPLRQKIGEIETQYINNTSKSVRENLEISYQETLDQLYQLVDLQQKNNNDYMETVDSIRSELLLNQKAREKIVDVLGGVDFCQTIPVIEIDSENPDSYLLGKSQLLPTNLNWAQLYLHNCPFNLRRKS